MCQISVELPLRLLSGLGVQDPGINSFDGAKDKEDVSRVFGPKADDKFSEIGWKHSGNGAPVINGALVFIDGDLRVGKHGSGGSSGCVGAPRRRRHR